MTYAVVSLAIMVVVLGGAVVWAVREAIIESRASKSMSIALNLLRGFEADRARERDIAMGEVARLESELSKTRDKLKALEQNLNSLREAQNAQALQNLRNADPVDLPSVIDEQLQARRRSITIAGSPYRGPAPDSTLPGPGTSTTPTGKLGGVPKP